MLLNIKWPATLQDQFRLASLRSSFPRQQLLDSNIPAKFAEPFCLFSNYTPDSCKATQRAFIRKLCTDSSVKMNLFSREMASIERPFYSRISSSHFFVFIRASEPIHFPKKGAWKIYVFRKASTWFLAPAIQKIQFSTPCIRSPGFYTKDIASKLSLSQKRRGKTNEVGGRESQRHCNLKFIWRT